MWKGKIDYFKAEYRRKVSDRKRRSEAKLGCENRF